MSDIHNKKYVHILLYYPFGMGDQIICHGIVREYARSYKHVTVLAKDHNYPSVAFMYRDTSNITVLEIHKTPLELTETSVILDTPNRDQLTFDLIKIIGLNYLVWDDQSIQFEKQLYDIAGVPLMKKWSNFFVERDLKKERVLFKKVALKHDYVFVHEDPERKYIINRDLLNKDLAVITPDKDLTNNIFDYCTLIENAKELHVIDSSFMFLIDCLPYHNPKQKLFVHRYARDNNECLLPILKKDWGILVERHDKWEPIKDMLTALWFHRYYQKRRFSTVIFKIVRKIFWIMGWNMTRPEHPDIQALIQRYTPGRSFGQVVSSTESHHSYLPLAKKMEATDVVAIDLSSPENYEPKEVIFSSLSSSASPYSLALLHSLYRTTNKILILHIPHPKEALSLEHMRNILTQAGFEIREEQLFRNESVFVCKKVMHPPTTFSIITPVYNGEKYIVETIESVLSQEGDFEIEYIVQDGGSTDDTLKIVQSYKDRIESGQYPIRCKKITLQYFSEKDHGMYAAIEKGFARTTGDVMAYINADDKYLPGAFATAAKIFTQYPDIEWLKGINTTSDEQGTIVNQGLCLLYRQDWLRKGIYGRNAYFVQQDSVFWKQSLWEKARPNISSFRFAGDYALWITFAQHAPLWSFNKPVSVFREREGQLSGTMGPYRQEQEAIAPHHFFLEKRVMLFFVSTRFFKLDSQGVAARLLFFVLFPFSGQQWYIDLDPHNPIKKRALSYII